MSNRLGASDVKLSRIGLGCMTMAGDYGVADEAESVATIHCAIDLGINFFDTADAYGRGSNEELLGRALKGKRRQAVVATKMGTVFNPDGTPSVNGRPDYVPRACDASLKRLGIDVIDLWYLHRVDPLVPIEDTIGTMAGLVRKGKVRSLGLSEAGPSTIRRAHAIHPIAALQTEYSLWARDAEGEVLPLCRSLGITFVAYSPLGRGFLSGRVRSAGSIADKDRRANFPRFQGPNLERNLELLRPLEKVAQAQECTPAQAALAWILVRQPGVVPIPGSKRRLHLEENDAAQKVHLGPAETEALERAFPPGAAQGDRYGPAQMKYLNL